MRQLKEIRNYKRYLQEVKTEGTDIPDGLKATDSEKL